jgi:hypothetical protein
MFFRSWYSFELANDAILTFNKIDPNNITLVLLQGEIAISRKYNDVLLGIARAPFIKGLSTGLIQRPSEYIYRAKRMLGILFAF